MGKNNKKRKRNHALFHAVKARMNGETPEAGPPEVLPEATAEVSSPDEISDADLATTTATLHKLVSNPTVFHSKRFKDLRRALHPLVLEQLQSYDKGVDYRHKVTHALNHQHWADALAALQACQDFQQLPKQGTVQRWVRDCMPAGNCQFQLLQAILRLSTAGDGNKHDPGQALAEHLASNADAKEELAILEGWKWWDNEASEDKKAEDEPTEKLEEGKTEEMTVPSKLESRILYRESAAERTPPNHYDLLLHTTEPGSITWSSTTLPTAFHPVPFLPQPARVLSSVFTVDECQQLRQVMTTLGYRPDHPVSMSKPTGIDSCEWMIDQEVADKLFERVRPHLPEILELPSKKTVQLHSINPRWRGFRYGPDCVYRPHLDGSWPQSYIDENGNYACPKQSAVKSYLTFLIYLNEDFEGGETRFYLPQGIARGIVPRTGSVAVFPQGNLASLIHEGSQVTKGFKYVVRTDVLYRPVLLGGQEEEEGLNDEDEDDENTD